MQAALFLMFTTESVSLVSLNAGLSGQVLQVVVMVIWGVVLFVGDVNRLFFLNLCFQTIIKLISLDH